MLFKAEKEVCTKGRIYLQKIVADEEKTGANSV
jgi:hypothetical protein